MLYLEEKIGHGVKHHELSGCITTLTVVDVANFCAAMNTLIDQDEYKKKIVSSLRKCFKRQHEYLK